MCVCVYVCIILNKTIEPKRERSRKENDGVLYIFANERGGRTKEKLIFLSLSFFFFFVFFLAVFLLRSIP